MCGIVSKGVDMVLGVGMCVVVGAGVGQVWLWLILIQVFICFRSTVREGFKPKKGRKV